MTVEQISDEPNTEVRRVMIDRFGADRYLRDGGGVRAHSDECGTL